MSISVSYSCPRIIIFSPEKIREISDFALDIIMKDLNSKRMTDNSDVETFNKVECSEETIMGDNEGGSGY